MAGIRIKAFGRKCYFSFGRRRGFYIHAYQRFPVTQIRIYLYIVEIDFGSRLQFDFTYDSVPVALCLVGDAM